MVVVVVFRVFLLTGNESLDIIDGSSDSMSSAVAVYIILVLSDVVTFSDLELAIAVSAESAFIISDADGVSVTVLAFEDKFCVCFFAVVVVVVPVDTLSLSSVLTGVLPAIEFTSSDMIFCLSALALAFTIIANISRNRFILD